MSPEGGGAPLGGAGRGCGRGGGIWGGDQPTPSVSGVRGSTVHTVRRGRRVRGSAVHMMMVVRMWRCRCMGPRRRRRRRCMKIASMRRWSSMVHMMMMVVMMVVVVVVLITMMTMTGK